MGMEASFFSAIGEEFVRVTFKISIERMFTSKHLLD
jgi:hypothetical protein